MGLEARCTGTWRGETALVRAHLDSTGLEITGPIRVHLDLARIKAAEAHQGSLRLRTSEGTLVLALAHQAEKWAQFIRHPRSRIDKLGIKAGQRVRIVGLDDRALDADLASRACVVLRRDTKSPVDAAMVLVDTPEKLGLIARYRPAISPDGALWVIRPKGKETPVTEAQVREAAIRAGLVDVKVVAFSDTLSAAKLMIPRAQRGA